jgi:hypothetical protein
VALATVERELDAVLHHAPARMVGVLDQKNLDLVG